MCKLNPGKLWWMNLGRIKSLVNFCIKSNSSSILIFILVWANWTETLFFLTSYVGIIRDECSVFQHFWMNLKNFCPNNYEVISWYKIRKNIPFTRTDSLVNTNFVSWQILRKKHKKLILEIKCKVNKAYGYEESEGSQKFCIDTEDQA